MKKIMLKKETTMKELLGINEEIPIEVCYSGDRWAEYETKILNPQDTVEDIEESLWEDCLNCCQDYIDPDADEDEKDEELAYAGWSFVFNHKKYVNFLDESYDLDEEV